MYLQIFSDPVFPEVENSLDSAQKWDTLICRSPKADDTSIDAVF